MSAVFAVGAATPDIATAPPEAIAAGTRITFTVATLWMLTTLALRLGVSGPSSPSTPAPTLTLPPGDVAGTVGFSHGHIAVIKAAQLAAGVVSREPR